MDTQRNIPFTLYPGEIGAVKCAEQLRLAITEIESKQPSKSLTHLTAYLKVLASIDERKYGKLESVIQERYVSAAFWVTTIRRATEDQNAGFNPLFPSRIRLWLHGKTMLFDQVARQPDRIDTHRATQFLREWLFLLEKHSLNVVH